ncbi:ketopantoate reductase family protein [Hymenobacter arizonensis]|uniref:2-dehydropantoate 2-reductase n=1 Tax=Hymenobacter arizonensis TaxID=1227077 RepID=A0A1I5UJB1_HYMAR|nr:2-dehydropantoate 2-reductase [Hymenobacter arizonensis]SFP95308.1 2-dehydropantoate 2-reductase [Hymenobacter arizonensis]
MIEATDIAVVGLGGVGGYFGFKLAQHYANNPAARVTFVARGATYATVQAEGLTLLSAEHAQSKVRPATLLDSVSALGEADLLLICVKEYDLEAVCRELQPRLAAGAVLLPLMNGVDIYDRIRRIIPQAIILPACVYVASHIKEKAVVEHKGNPGKIIAGQDPQHPDFDPRPVVSLLAEAGINIEYQPDAFPAIWTKFFFIASFGLVSARYNKPIGQVLEEPELRERARRLMLEIAAIARAKNIALPAEIVDQTFQKAATFPYHTPTSLQLDVQSGKPQTELELFAGALLAYGADLGLPVVETHRIYTEIKALIPA